LRCIFIVPVLVTRQEQEPPWCAGPRASLHGFERNPGGTFKQFMSEMGSGDNWQKLNVSTWHWCKILPKWRRLLLA